MMAVELAGEGRRHGERRLWPTDRQSPQKSKTDRVFHNQFISSMHGPILAIRGLLLELARVEVCQTMHLKSREQLPFVVPYLGILNFPRILPLLSDCSLASSTGSFILEPCGPLLAEKRGPNTLYTNFIVTMSRV